MVTPLCPGRTGQESSCESFAMTGRSASLRPPRGGVLGAERQRDILASIDRGETVSVGEFADRFGVSHETIRRDIRGLEESGHLRRVHGGAVPTRTFDLTARRPVAERLGVDRAAKREAARAAMALLENDMNVFLGASSTMLLLAEELAGSGKALTVTTNMLDIASVVAAGGRCCVTLLGGVVDPRTRTVSGLEVLEGIDNRLFDLSILGASAISPVHGVLGPTAAHRVLATTLRVRSRRCAFAVDGAKFGRGDAQLVMPLARVDAVATDLSPPEDIIRAFAEEGVEVVLPATCAGPGGA